LNGIKSAKIWAVFWTGKSGRRKSELVPITTEKAAITINSVRRDGEKFDDLGG
jgi:hypothetical protein